MFLALIKVTAVTENGGFDGSLSGGFGGGGGGMTKL